MLIKRYALITRHRLYSRFYGNCAHITYGLLIDILKEVQKDCSSSGDIPRQLVSKIQIINPDLTVGRENCFCVVLGN